MWCVDQWATRLTAAGWDPCEILRRFAWQSIDILVVGQSNAAGASVEAAITDPSTNRIWGAWSLEYAGTGTVENPQVPLFNNWNGHSFAEEMLRWLNRREFNARLIPAAISGASIRLWEDLGLSWHPGDPAPTMQSPDGSAWPWTLRRAGECDRVDVICFQQGEADQGQMADIEWATAAADVLTRLKAQVGHPDTVVLIGEPPRDPGTATLLARIPTLAGMVPGSVIVSSEGADWQNWHFTKDGADEMGRRYAAQIRDRVRG